MSMSKKKITVVIDEEKHKRVKAICAKHGITLQYIVDHIFELVIKQLDEK